MLSKDIFEFEEAKIVCGNNGAGVRVIDRLGVPGGMGLKGTGNLFGYKGYGITSDGEGLDPLFSAVIWESKWNLDILTIFSHTFHLFLPKY